MTSCLLPSWLLRHYGAIAESKWDNDAYVYHRTSYRTVSYCIVSYLKFLFPVCTFRERSHLLRCHITFQINTDVLLELSRLTNVAVALTTEGYKKKSASL